MTLNSAIRVSLTMLVVSVLVCSGSAAPIRPDPKASVDPGKPFCADNSSLPLGLLTAVDLGCGSQLNYLGVYLSDGKYLPLTNMTRWYNRANLQNGEREPDIQAAVPQWANLHAREQTVENLQPASHAKKTMKGPSGWANFRDNVITFAYGHQRLFEAPQRVTTDSAGRVIICDPAAASIHVLGEDRSFRILTGPNRRIVKPSGIAADADDNIYIADSEQGIVGVFDRNGRFLRYIGKFPDGETLFHYPMGIAIDRAAKRLYVLDTERHLLFIMDLQGNVIRRVGRYQGNDAVVEFEYPSEVAVNGHQVAVLDAAATRVWITDLDGSPLHHFNFEYHEQPEMADLTGLALDAMGNVYLSHPRQSNVLIYSPGGQLLSSFGRVGTGPSEFVVPTGISIDARERIYVTDQHTRRVQVFQLTNPEPAMMAGGQ